jgi:CheY-like chemotaxis protein
MLEDSPLDAELIREQLERSTPKPEIRLVSNRQEFVKALEERDFDLILSDFSLPDFDGMTALEMASREVPEIPFIFVSGILGEEAAIESFRRGATDYVLKQRLIRLPAAVERALAEAHEKAELRRAHNQTELLVRELSHRVKNTMAMIMSLVRRTAKSSHTVDDYALNLLGRLRAMADAHALLEPGRAFRRRPSDTGTLHGGPRRQDRDPSRSSRSARPEVCAGAQHGLQRADDQRGEIWRPVAGRRSDLDQLGARRLQ